MSTIKQSKELKASLIYPHTPKPKSLITISKKKMIEKARFNHSKTRISVVGIGYLSSANTTVFKIMANVISILKMLFSAKWKKNL